MNTTQDNKPKVPEFIRKQLETVVETDFDSVNTDDVLADLGLSYQDVEYLQEEQNEFTQTYFSTEQSQETYLAAQ